MPHTYSAWDNEVQAEEVTSVTSDGGMRTQRGVLYRYYGNYPHPDFAVLELKARQASRLLEAQETFNQAKSELEDAQREFERPVDEWLPQLEMPAFARRVLSSGDTFAQLLQGLDLETLDDLYSSDSTERRKLHELELPLDNPQGFAEAVKVIANEGLGGPVREYAKKVDDDDF